MKNKRRRVIQWDALEERTVLSAAPSVQPLVAHVQRVRAPRAPAVSGTIRGTFQFVPAQAIAGTIVGPHVEVNGTGNVRPLGPVAANGFVIGGTAAGDRVDGTLVLANERGSVVLNLSGRVPRNPRATEQVRVLVSDGTGEFSTLTGRGTGTLRLGQISTETLSGNFNLSFRTNPPRR